jgi:SAM-dependent methyltransferase
MSIHTATYADHFETAQDQAARPVAATKRGPAITACVACGSTDIGHWKTKRFQYTEGSELEEFPIDRCGRCGTGFINPPPSPEWLREIYQYSGHALTGPTSLDEVMAREERFPNSTVDAARMARRADKLNKSGSDAALDIGSGFGFYTRALRQRGFRTVSINPGGYENAVFKQMNGYEPLPIMLEDYQPESPFGVVVLSQVLEHLLEPEQAVSRIASMLKSGGVLACAVPNFDAFTVKLLGTRDNACLWVPEHVNYFTVRGLKTLLESNGFKVVLTEQVTRAPRGWLMKHLPAGGPLAAVLDRLTGWLEKPLAWVMNGLGLGIYFNVYAVKE